MNYDIKLLDLAYSYLKKLNHSDTFENIWNIITSKSDYILQENNKEEIIAELYTDLVLDNRFILTNEGMWKLR